jgi:hypothetical protein
MMSYKIAQEEVVLFLEINPNMKGGILMKRFRISVLMLALCVAGTTFATSYLNNFEAESIGTLPAGWTVIGWGDWAPGPLTANVQAGPTGGQALKLVLGTDWANYGASSGEAHYTMAGGAGVSTMSVSYDMWIENWRVWRIAGDQSWVPPAGWHQNDSPADPNTMVVGTDDYGSANKMTDVPEDAWIHFEASYDSASGNWQTTVSYAGGGGGGAFSGTYATPNAIAGEYFIGGWAFQSTMDASPTPPGGTYENALYLDNFALTYGEIPEPGTLSMFVLGLLGLAAFRRKK